MYQAPGESVTLECSSAGCPRSIEKHSGMTLYWEYEERGEVLYYHTSPGSADKVTPRKGYENRVQTNGSLKNLTVTISSLTVNDTGFYRCVYTKFPSDRVQCNVHKLFVRGVSFLLLLKYHTSSSLKGSKAVVESRSRRQLARLMREAKYRKGQEMTKRFDIQ